MNYSITSAIYCLTAKQKQQKSFELGNREHKAQSFSDNDIEKLLETGQNYEHFEFAAKECTVSY